MILAAAREAAHSLFFPLFTGLRMPGRLRHLVAISLLAGGTLLCRPAGCMPPCQAADPDPFARPRQEAITAASALRTLLEADPLGVILVPELELDWLAAELARDPPESAPLASLERTLRKILPGRAREPLDRLRQQVGRLARLARRVEEGPAAAAAARAVLDLHLGSQRGASAVADDDLRSGFAALAAVAADDVTASELRALRDRLSSPNVSVLLKRDYVQSISKRTFTQPVAFQETREGTAIKGRGEVSVAISVRVPESAGENRLVVEALGTGRIDATADGRRVHVAARAVPQVTGSDTVRLTPRTVVVEPPQVAARFSTRVQSVQVAGLVGRCRLVQRIARRAAQEALSGNDPAVARDIERTVATRVEDESAALATRINGLLQWGVWERLAALDFTPEVRLANDSLGLRSDTWYAAADQLGAVPPRPEIPAADLTRLDIVTWAHESALNNSLAALAGLRLDEATVRGLWEVQCKLRSPEWDALPPARIPAVITLASDRPLGVRVVPDGIDVVLRATSCERDGQPLDEGLREIRLRYRLARDTEGWHFVRGAAEIDAPGAMALPAERAAAWQETLGLFCGRTIRPLPKYRPSGLSQYLSLGYMDVQEGWLVVGATRVADAVGSEEGSR
jgi:hypothetical protein